MSSLAETRRQCIRESREGKFQLAMSYPTLRQQVAIGVTVLDFDHDGWMDLAFTH